MPFEPLNRELEYYKYVTRGLHNLLIDLSWQFYNNNILTLHCNRYILPLISTLYCENEVEMFSGGFGILALFGLHTLGVM